jgi:Protein of unknown function DUF262
VPYQTPITIRAALDRIFSNDYVLPAIQREFVWSPEQICLLFDSLMRGYPFGSFLFWKVDASHSSQYKFYGFVTDYHQRDNPHCPALSVPPGKAVVAILDGQQRLTALNIGLRGSHAIKAPRKWWDNPEAFPQKFLCLNLLSLAPENEAGMKYDFEFLAKDGMEDRDDSHFWCPVSKIPSMETGADIHEYLVDNGLGSSKEAYRNIERLHAVVHRDFLITFFEEESQDIEKVLNIFIRTNSGGTVLSYSDLLLSIATAQWDKLDARKEIYGLVDRLNDIRHKFTFSKDFVLKAGLMLCDVTSVGFKVENFNHANMAILEAHWRRIEKALTLTVQLVASFGFSGQTLSADSALLPICYYLYPINASDNYLSSKNTSHEREQIRFWLARSLLKPGVWGSGLDTMLTGLRTAIQENSGKGFPTGELESVMLRRGRGLKFEEDELEDLADIAYGDKRVFPLLSLLYAFVDLRNEFHVDHVFSRSQFSTVALRRAGIPEDRLEQVKGRSERLANLQLLEGGINESKNSQAPHEWIELQYADQKARNAYLSRYDLEGLPNTVGEFDNFYESRRVRLLSRLKGLLGSK